MRLTLRTLLAYLDDTLEPAEAKQIGAKLAESEPAQEIVERMRNVIRRRRLTVPPAASRIDPNTLAEYLDNQITPEQAEELERICLASDVHLAEVAACHQILTLILGEPAEVPPEVVGRMYEIGKGKHAVTAAAPRPALRAKPAPVASPVPPAPHEDDTLLMGLPPLAQRGWLGRTAVILGAAVGSVLLVVAIWQLLQPPVVRKEGPGPDQVAQQNPVRKPVPPPREPEVLTALPKKEDKGDAATPIPVAPPETPAKIKEEPPAKVKEDPPAKEKEEPPAKPKDLEVTLPPPALPPLPPPTFSTVAGGDAKEKSRLADIPNRPAGDAVVAVGHHAEPVKDYPAILLQRSPKKEEWIRVPAGKGAEVVTANPLVAPPGAKAVVQVGKKVRLTLWGNLPEQIPAPPLQESRVELHAPDKVDVDLTLHRGRVVLTGTRDAGAVLVRVRFENSSDLKASEASWLFSLAGKDAEVMIDRWGILPWGEPFYRDRDNPDRKGPVTGVAALVLGGLVTLKTPGELVTLHPAPQQNLAVWYSRNSKLGLQVMQPLLDWLNPQTKVAPKFLKVRQELEAAFADRAVDLALTTLGRSKEALVQRTGVRFLGALDDLVGLIEKLNHDKQDPRTAAVETLYLWIAASRDNDYLLYDKLKARYNFADAETVMHLLHGFGEPAAARPETYELLIQYLTHREMAIRELASWNLTRLAPGAKVPYDAADPLKREQGQRQWLKLIPPGKLPAPALKKVASQPTPPQPVVFERYLVGTPDRLLPMTVLRANHRSIHGRT